MAAKIKLTDYIIRYAASGKSNKTNLLFLSNALTSKGQSLKDTEVKGFQVYRSGQSTISFRYDYFINGLRKNLTIGQWPTITAVQARAIAKSASLQVAMGQSPLDSKDETRVNNQLTLQSYLNHEYTLYIQKAISGDAYIALIKNAFPEFLKKPLSEITKTDLVIWLQKQMTLHSEQKYGYSSASIKRRYSTLKTLFSHAVRNDAIQQSPFDKMERLEFSRDEVTNQQLKRTYLTIEQQQCLLTSLDHYQEKLRAERRNSRLHGKPQLPCLDNLIFTSYHKPMFLLLYYMGMRAGDVIGLEWPHIIDTPFSCNITKTLEKTRRKIKKPFVLPMPPPVRIALKEWKKQQGNPSIGLVFPSPITGARLSKSCLRHSWKWIKTDAGFHEDLQMYTLRHNFISWLVMQGTPLKVVAEMAGHSSIEMIDQHYCHLIDGATADASNCFSQLLTG